MNKGSINFALGLKGQTARRREVAALDAVGAFAIIDPFDHFRDQKVEIEIALTMPMAPHVDRRTIDITRQIGAMIEVETAKEKLVRLTRPAVLRGDQA